MSDAQNEPAARRPWYRRTGWMIALVLIVLLGFVLVHLLKRKKPQAPPAPQSVKVAQATTGDMPEVLTELGTVTPTHTVTVLPQLSGYLTEVAYREGEDVRKGQFLAQIDPRQYEINLRQAQAALLKDQAALEQARADLARYQQLHEQKAIAEQTVADQEFQVKQDQAQVQSDQAQIAQFQLDLIYCHITAPVAGRVGLRLVDPGNYVTASSSPGIVVITTMKPTTVQFTVAQNDLDRVIERTHAGAKLPVEAWSSDGTRPLGRGTLYALSNQMASSTGTVTLRASFPNDDEALFPNAFVNVRMLVDTLQKVVLVPTPAVLNGAPGDYVYLVKPDQTVAMTKVKLGPSDGKNTAILSGLSAGESVVINGTDRLNDGSKISVATAASAPASGASAAAQPAARHHGASAPAGASGVASAP